MELQWSQSCWFFELENRQKEMDYQRPNNDPLFLVIRFLLSVASVYKSMMEYFIAKNIIAHTIISKVQKADW